MVTSRQPIRQPSHLNSEPWATPMARDRAGAPWGAMGTFEARNSSCASLFRRSASVRPSQRSIPGVKFQVVHTVSTMIYHDLSTLYLSNLSIYVTFYLLYYKYH